MRKNVGACLETVLGSNKQLSEKRDQHGDPKSSVAHLPRVKHTAMSDESTPISNNHVRNFRINFQCGKRVSDVRISREGIRLWD